MAPALAAHESVVVEDVMICPTVGDVFVNAAGGRMTVNDLIVLLSAYVVPEVLIARTCQYIVPLVRPVMPAVVAVVLCQVISVHACWVMAEQYS